MILHLSFPKPSLCTILSIGIVRKKTLSGSGKPESELLHQLMSRPAMDQVQYTTVYRKKPNN